MPDEFPESRESELEARRQTVVSLAVIVEGGLFAIAVLWGWMIDQPPVRMFAWTLPAVFWGVVATLPLAAFFVVFQRWPIGPLGRIRRFSEEVIRPLLAPCSLVDLLGISVLAGLGEETLFRGILQTVATRWFSNVWIAVAAVSILFGLVHSITVTYALLAALMGAYLSLVWLYCDQNLLVVALAHALYDFLVLLWLMRGPGAAEALAAQQARQEAEKAKTNEPEA